MNNKFCLVSKETYFPRIKELWLFNFDLAMYLPKKKFWWWHHSPAIDDILKSQMYSVVVPYLNLESLGFYSNKSNHCKVDGCQRQQTLLLTSKMDNLIGPDKWQSTNLMIAFWGFPQCSREDFHAVRVCIQFMRKVWLNRPTLTLLAINIGKPLANSRFKLKT